jgi:hypothetical protein
MRTITITSYDFESFYGIYVTYDITECLGSMLFAFAFKNVFSIQRSESDCSLI